MYGPPDLLYGYWEMHSLRWEGEKAAVRYLEAHDPAYLATYPRFLHQTDLPLKLALYEELAAEAMDALRAPWPQDATTVAFDGAPATSEQIETGLRVWEELLSST